MAPEGALGWGKGVEGAAGWGGSEEKADRGR